VSERRDDKNAHERGKEKKKDTLIDDTDTMVMIIMATLNEAA